MIPLSPPVIFLTGDIFRQIKELDLSEYGFSASSTIPAEWIESDADNINGSDNILVVHGNVSQGQPRFMAIIGYVVITQIASTNNTYQNRLKLVTPSDSKPRMFLIGYYNTTISGDNLREIRVSSDISHSGYYYPQITELRVMKYGVISNIDKWGISIVKDQEASIAFIEGYTTSTVITTASPSGIESYSYNRYPGQFSENYPGLSVLEQVREGFPMYAPTNTQIPGMPPFLIWESRIFARCDRAYIEMGPEAL